MDWWSFAERSLAKPKPHNPPLATNSTLPAISTFLLPVPFLPRRTQYNARGFQHSRDRRKPGCAQLIPQFPADHSIILDAVAQTWPLSATSAAPPHPPKSLAPTTPSAPCSRRPAPYSSPSSYLSLAAPKLPYLLTLSQHPSPSLFPDSTYPGSSPATWPHPSSPRSMAHHPTAKFAQQSPYLATMATPCRRYSPDSPAQGLRPRFGQTISSLWRPASSTSSAPGSHLSLPTQAVVQLPQPV
jgi:hypothetical protein